MGKYLHMVNNGGIFTSSAWMEACCRFWTVSTNSTLPLKTCTSVDSSSAWFGCWSFRSLASSVVVGVSSSTCAVAVAPFSGVFHPSSSRVAPTNNNRRSGYTITNELLRFQELFMLTDMMVVNSLEQEIRFYKRVRHRWDTGRDSINRARYAVGRQPPVESFIVYAPEPFTDSPLIWVSVGLDRTRKFLKIDLIEVEFFWDGREMGRHSMNRVERMLWKQEPVEFSSIHHTLYSLLTILSQEKVVENLRTYLVHEFKRNRRIRMLFMLKSLRKTRKNGSSWIEKYTNTGISKGH